MRSTNLAAIFLGALAISSSAQRPGLSVSIEASPRAAAFGDRIAFNIRYCNRSEHPIGIMPDNFAYQAQLLALERNDGTKVTRVPFAMVSPDPKLIARSFRVLRPNECFSRQVIATLSEDLREKTSSGNFSKGAYLVLPGSAIKLPSVGAYRLSTSYSEIEDDRALLKDRDGSLLWIGEVKSAPITVEFRNRR
jgi:hypothetical protein